MTSNLHEEFEGSTIRFDGSVNITIKVAKETKSVILHQKNLFIFSASIFDGKSEIRSSFNYDAEILAITLQNKTLTMGKTFVVQIQYYGHIRGDEPGFYRYNHKSNDDQEKLAVATKFKYSGSRIAFPCFDEPSKKATFNFTFTHGRGYTVISNTEAINDPVFIIGTDLVTTTFKRTPLMSTHKTAFVISNFVHYELVSQNLRQRVYSEAPVQQYLKFALNISEKCIAFLDKYLGIEYNKIMPSGKLDLVAFPDNDSIFTESLGLNLLFVEENLTNDMTIAYSVGYADAQQWFGNYVGIEWWSYLWLEQAFAAYYSLIAVDKVGYN